MNRQSILVPSLWSKKIVQRLHFTDEGLLIEKTAGKTSVINWRDIDGVKIKSNVIKGLYFNVGHQFSIQLKNDKGQVHSIDMNSIYGIRKRLFEQLWSDIFRLMFDFHFKHLLGYYMELHAIGQEFSLDGVTVYTDGISWDRHPKFLWDEIEVTVHGRFFVIRNRFGIQYRKFLYYSTDWNACILLDLLRQLINAHNGIVRKSTRQK